MRLDVGILLAFAIFLGFESEASYVGYCYYDKFSFPMGYSTDLYSACMRLTCLNGGNMRVDRCPTRRPPPGKKFGKYKYPHEDFPKCCAREIVEGDPHLKGGRFYTPEYYCCTTRSKFE